MRVHFVMRCGHVQEWPPGGALGVGSCGFARWRAWLVSESGLRVEEPGRCDGYASWIVELQIF